MPYVTSIPCRLRRTHCHSFPIVPRYIRIEIPSESLPQKLLTQLHMPSLRNLKLQPPLLVQPLQPQPILLVQSPLLHFRNLIARLIILRKIRALLWHHCRIFLEHKHDKPLQPLQIILISGVLDLALVVNIGEEITVLKVRLQILRIPVILRRHEPRLHEIGPGIPLQVPVPALADPVIIAAILELADTVVLAAEGDEGVDGGVVAALDVGAEELAALGEAEGVDGGGER